MGSDGRERLLAAGRLLAITPIPERAGGQTVQAQGKPVGLRSLKRPAGSSVQCGSQLLRLAYVHRHCGVQVLPRRRVEEVGEGAVTAQGRLQDLQVLLR